MSGRLRKSSAGMHLISQEAEQGLGKNDVSTAVAVVRSDVPRCAYIDILFFHLRRDVTN